MSDAIMTGRKRLDELSSSASTGSAPLSSWKLISSISTMPFFIIMPMRPSTPTMATKPNVLPDISIPNTTPVKMSGMQRKMMAGFL